MTIKNFILGIIVSCLWGSSCVSSKLAFQHLPPFFFMFLRYIILLPLLLFFPKPNLPWKGLMFIGGVIGFFPFCFVSIALDKSMYAGTATLILQSNTFFTILFAWIIIREEIVISQIIGIFIGFAGVALIGYNFEECSTTSVLALILAGAISSAVGNISIKKLKIQVNLAFVVWISMVPIIPFLLLSFLYEKKDIFVPSFELSWRGVTLIFYGGYILTLIGNALWFYLIKRCNIIQLSYFGLLTPVFSIIFGNLFLNEFLSINTTLGALFVLAGLFISQGYVDFQRFYAIVNSSKKSKS